MIRGKTKALLLLLMAMISITTAYADERDMGTWSENTGFGQNAEDWTADGYSKWDGQSFQNYELRTSGEQQGIHIANAAQLARYAYDMYNYTTATGQTAVRATCIWSATSTLTTSISPSRVATTTSRTPPSMVRAMSSATAMA